MSNWTHVAGIIRVDGIREWDVVNADGLRDIMGKEVHFHDAKDVWMDYDEHPEEYLPCGSEGSLHMSIWENPNTSSMAAYTVSIFGDLRNHDSAMEIIEWFRHKTLLIDCVSLGVRNACVTATNECNGTENWTYDDSRTHDFINSDNTLATILSDNVGTSVCFNDGTIEDFDDNDSAMEKLKSIGYRKLGERL